MTQELFGKKVDERGELIARIKMYWRIHNEKYRTLPIKYRFYVSTKKMLKIEVHPIKASTLKDYPIVSLMDILDEEVLGAELHSYNTESLRMVCAKMEELGFNYSYLTIQNWVQDAQYIIGKKLIEQECIKNQKISPYRYAARDGRAKPITPAELFQAGCHRATKDF